MAHSNFKLRVRRLATMQFQSSLTGTVLEVDSPMRAEPASRALPSLAMLRRPQAARGLSLEQIWRRVIPGATGRAHNQSLAGSKGWRGDMAAMACLANVGPA